MEKKGDCYELAAMSVLTNPEWVLVHGVITGTDDAVKGIKYAHAWAEDGDEVIDLTLPADMQKLPKETYYALGNVELTTKYTYKELVQNLVTSEHFGPWEEKFYEYA